MLVRKIIPIASAAFKKASPVIFRQYNLTRNLPNFHKSIAPSIQRIISDRRFSSRSSSDNNLLNPEKYTEQAWEILAKLPLFSEKYNVQYIEAAVLLKSMIDKEHAGLTQRVLSKAGIDVKKFTE